MWSAICFMIIFIAPIPAAINYNCSGRWEQWKPCPQPPKLSIHVPIIQRCFLDGHQLFHLALSYINGLTIICPGQPPDLEILNCLNVTAIHSLSMLNCRYSNFNLESYLKGKGTSLIHIGYDDIPGVLITADLVISNLPLLENITINGLKSTGPFNVTFGILPNLITLSVTNYNFTSFNKHPFRHLYSLQALILRSGVIETIPEDLFYGLKNLRFLDLSWNRLSNFHPSTFKKLILLSDLVLSGNNIEHLPPTLISDLLSLATLHIQQNKLISLPTGLFKHVPTLFLLDISGNKRIDYIPRDFFIGANQLQKFIAMNCSLNSLEETLFSNTGYLTYVALSINYLKNIPQGFFNNTENLVHLFLDINEIDHLSARTFYRLFRLETLSISYNKLESLDGACFTGLSSLIYLDLSVNKLVNIAKGTFQPLSNLRELHLSNNPLTTVPPHYPFGKSIHLSLIVAKNCHLSELPNINWTNANLTSVDFSNNLVSNVTLPVFTKNRTEVLLLNNKISYITLDFKNVSNISPTYHIRGNPIRCDCPLQDFVQFLHSDIQEINSIFDDVDDIECLEYNNKSPMSIWPPYIICPSKSKECPSQCDCYVTSQRNGVIECSNKQLTAAPSVIPFESTILYLQNNNITKLPNSQKEYWTNIEELFLSNNSIGSLEGWNIPPKLRLLSIEGNNLTDLPSSLMEKVDSIPDFKMYLSENSWKCDCQSIPLKRWLDKNSDKIKDLKSTTCARYSQENETMVQSSITNTPIDLFCVEYVMLPPWQIAVVSLGVLILVIISSSCVGYYRYRNTILSLLYSRNMYCVWWDRNSLDEDKIFDAFLCYSSYDRDVVMEMIGELEPSYKLCIHERDWLPGYAISHHIVNSVQSSRKTLLLLSKNFLESIWFQVEFRTAYSQMLEDRIHRLVLIIVGDIGDISNLEEDLRHLLSTKTYLKWGEKWFWEKLRYALRTSSKQVSKS